MSTAAAITHRTCPRCGARYERDAAFCAKDGTALGPDDDLPPDSDPYIGTVISGDIELRTVAGVGAMGRVYRAHQRGIDRDVAVKILHRELSGNTQLVQRFHREAKIASKLQHPHVVEVYLAGQLPDKALYIVMEYLDGMSLAAALAAAGGAFTPARALSIALQICDAVGEGHARGIVHRDLKPENIMLVRRAEMGDWVKVLDFGIAKVSLGEQSMQTAAGLVFGTARYISPEGAQGTNVAPSGDVYSLAVIVYQMLAGKTPFDAEPVGLLIKHIHEPPPPITSLPRTTDLHPALAKVVMDNLAKDPAKRAQGARAFAAALAAAARDANISISEVGVVARLSNVDFGRMSQALEPTLDDAASQKAIASEPPPPAPMVAHTVPIGTRTPPPPPMVDEEMAEDESASTTPPSQMAAPRRTTVVPIILAFLLGIVLAVAVTQHFVHRRDEERAAHLARTNQALNDGNYASPPGDNVRELVDVGLKRWPKDPDLLRIKSEAAHELVTRAMAARSSGDLTQGRDLAKLAVELDPTDRAARMVLDQYEDELGHASDGGLAAPRVLFELPAGRARAGQKVELVARVVVGGVARTRLNNPRFTLTGAGLTPRGMVVPATGSPSGEWRATFTPPEQGRYEVVFEANTDGVPLRAERDLDVTR